MWLAMLLVALAASMLTLRARGQQANPIDDPRLQKLVEQLSDESFETRESATQQLSDEASGYPLRDLERVLRRTSLTAEQRRRLMQAAFARFAREPRAALGVTSAIGESKVTLQAVRADYPAAAVLKPGDRIESLDGVPLDTFDSLRAIIIAHDPDDEIPVQLVRDGRTISTRVRLGLYGANKDFSPVAQFLPPAWTYRSRDYRAQELSDPKPIRVSFTPDAWRQGMEDETAELPRVEGGNPIPVAVGGEAVGDAQRLGFDGHRDAMGDVVFRVGDRPLIADAQIAQNRVLLMEQSVAVLRDQIEGLKQLQLRPNVPDRDRVRLQQRIDAMSVMLDQQKDELRRLRPNLRVAPNRPQGVIPNEVPK
jgi:hypothetical protein